MSVTLVLADDQPIILYGLEQLFAREQDFHVLASCTTGEETLEAVRGHRPAVLVLGLHLSAKDGFTVLRELRVERRRQTRVVLFSPALDEEQIVEAIHLGARGVVLKEMAPKLLVQCIRKVHAGGEWFETRSVSRILGEIRQRNTKTHRGGELTAREREIVSTVAWGLRNHEIAERLSIGVGTVKVHLHNIYAKLEVTNRVALFLRARERGEV